MKNFGREFVGLVEAGENEALFVWWKVGVGVVLVDRLSVVGNEVAMG